MNAQELTEFNRKRKITQLAIVTDDLRKTIKAMTEHFQWGPWYILKETEETTHDVFYEEKPAGKFLFYWAVAQVGDIQMEVIQPVEGLSPYDEFLKKHGTGFHHLKEGFIDNSDLIKRIQEFEELGNHKCYHGRFVDDIYCYFDTREDMGAFYEMANYGIADVDFSKMPGYIGQYPEE